MDESNGSWGCLVAIAFLIFGIVQIIAAYIGLDDWLGTGWAVAGIAAAFFLRTGLPILIGSFLCALNVWEWHWVFAAMFAAPLLFVIVPAMAMEAVSHVRRRQ